MQIQRSRRAGRFARHSVEFGQPVLDHFLQLHVVQYGLHLHLDGLLEGVHDDVPQQGRQRVDGYLDDVVERLAAVHLHRDLAHFDFQLVQHRFVADVQRLVDHGPDLYVVRREVGHADPLEHLGQAQLVLPPERAGYHARDDVHGHLEYGPVDLEPDIVHTPEVRQPADGELADGEVERALLDVPIGQSVRVVAHPPHVRPALVDGQIGHRHVELGQFAGDGLHLGVHVGLQVSVHFVDDERLDAVEQHRSHGTDDALEQGRREAQVLEVQLAVPEPHVHLRLVGLQVAVFVRHQIRRRLGVHVYQRHVERARRWLSEPRPERVVAQHVHSLNFQQHINLHTDKFVIEINFMIT